jgi:hypothetical protein
MGRINVPPYSRVTIHETPYLAVQVIPDRIKYQIAGGDPPTLLKTFITGDKGYNTKVEDYLEVLANMDRPAIAADGALFKAWLKYSAHAVQSTDLAKDRAMMTALEDFQRLACTGSSYNRLPEAAAQAKYWEKTSEVELPRITEEQHRKMG